MDELFSRVVLRLCRVREQFGQDLFEQAALQALLAIARTVHGEAEKRAAGPKVKDGNIIPLPPRDQ